MLKFTNKDREQLDEMKHGWFALVFIVLFSISQIFAEDHFGMIWRLVVALLALPLWLMIRPWQFGLLSQDARRKIKLLGVEVFIALALFAVLDYYQF